MTLLRKSLAARIFLAIAASAVLTIAIMGLLVALSMRDGFARYLLRAEMTRFDALVLALASDHDPDAPGWPDLMADPRAWNDFVRLHFDPVGGRTAPSDMQLRPPPGRPPWPPDPQVGADSLIIEERLMLLGPEGERLAGASHTPGLFEQRPICTDAVCSDGRVLGYLGLNAPQASVTGSDAFFLRRQYLSVALSALLALLVSAAAAYVVARRILTPIRQLETGAKKLASGDYAARIPQDSTDELGQLIGHYNALAASLERTEKAEREWISNTSHELQTPLATLRAQIEAVQDGVRPPDAATLEAMHISVMRLSRLVQDIRTLSHSREGRLATSVRPEDLAGILREAVATARPQIEAKGLALGLDIPDRLMLACDRLRIGQVLDNLLQNATRYTNAPGRILLRASDASDAVRLTIDDTPPAPTDADLPRLFERFFRAEGSRSRAFGGSGLGLSVTRAIVEVHGGTITAGASELGGLRITVTLPKVPT